MPEENNSNAVRAMYHALNQRNLNGMIDQFNDDAELLDVPTNSMIRGKQALSEYFQNWMNAFSNANGEIINLITSGEMIIVEVIGRGFHQNVFSTSYGNIPSSEENVEIKFCQIYKIQNNKIKSGTSYYDLFGLIQAAEKAQKKSA
jgi:ketosteroid isomerase-like protein